MAPFSLRIKMTVVVFLMVSAVISAVVGLGLFFFISEFKENVASRQLSVVSAMAVELDEKILAAQSELVAVARSIRPAQLRDMKEMQRFLDERLDVQQVFADGTGFLANGKLLACSPGQDILIGTDFSAREFYRRTAATGKPYISEPFRIARGAGHPTVVFTAPVFDEKGKLAGVLGGRLDLMEENFLGHLGHVKIAQGGDFFLFNSSRQLIVHPDRELVAGGEVGGGNRLLVERALAGFEGSGETVTRNGDPVLCSYRKLKTTGWILGAKLPVSEAYATIYRAEALVLSSLALALPAALLAVWFLVGRLTRPLLLLAGTVGDMAGEGGTFTPVPVASGDEIGVLASAFNKVMQELDNQRALLEKEKGLAEQLLRHTAVPCYVIDAEHRVIIWNRACEELTGLNAAEVLGTTEPWRAFYDSPRRVLADVVMDGSLHEMSDLYGCYADSPLIPEGLRAEGWFQLRGKQRYLAFDAAPIRDGEGRLIAAIQTLQDVTLRATTEEQLRGMVAAIGESEERFRRLVELSLDGIAILVDRRFVFINPAGCEMLGAVVPDELLGREMQDFIQRESEELFLEQLVYADQSGSNAPWVEERLLRRDRTSLDVELGVSRFVYRGEKALQVIFRDITERKLAKARLETLAHYDSLTALPNRVLFFDRLQHAVSEAERYRHPLALMFLDLDRFKEINDGLGHAAGDLVLVETGRRLKDCVRACDMVARMGGDEFTIILSKLADEVDAALVAERIIQSLSQPFKVEGTMATIGVSIGICVYPTYGTDLDGIVRQADLALYRAKRDGRNGYCFYRQGLETGTRD